MFFVDSGEIASAGLHVFAAFKQDGSVSQLNQTQPCKQSGGTATHNENRVSSRYARVIGSLRQIRQYFLATVNLTLKTHAHPASARIDGTLDGADPHASIAG